MPNPPSFAWAAALCLGAACGPAPDAAPRGAMLVVDDHGDSLRVELPAVRIASLIPATTEWLFAIGAANQIVGRSHWCDFPAPALALPDLGNGIEPNVEAIVAAAPDLVLLYASQANLRAAARLRDLGIPTLLLRTDDLNDMRRGITLLGKVTGHVGAADSTVQALDRGLAAVSAPSAGADSRPTVLLLAWDQPPMVLGRGSFLHELVERAGWRNLFGDLAAPSAAVSLEAIVARNPDVILTTADGPPAVASRTEWQAVGAVRGRRFLRVSGSAFSRPSPRAPEAIQELAGRLRAAAATP